MRIKTSYLKAAQFLLDKKANIGMKGKLFFSQYENDTILTATDGICLIRIRVPDTECNTPFSIPVFDMVLSKQEFTHVVYEDSKCTIGNVILAASEEGASEMVSRIIPQELSDSICMINPVVSNRIHKAVKELGSKEGLYSIYTDINNPGIFVVYHGLSDDIFIVGAGIKDTRKPICIKDWVRS